MLLSERKNTDLPSSGGTSEQLNRHLVYPNRWEKPSDPSAIGLIANEPPKCLLDFAEQGMLSTMHVWVDDYIVTCIGD